MEEQPGTHLVRINAEKDGSDVFRPVIYIRVKINGVTFQVPALLDSGADSTVLALGPIVAQSGLSEKMLVEFGSSIGIGGRQKHFTYPNEFRLSYRKTEFFKGNAPMMRGLPISILGRSDFFRHFIVRFLWHRSVPVFEIDPVVSPKKGKSQKKRNP